MGYIFNTECRICRKLLKIKVYQNNKQKTINCSVCNAYYATEGSDILAYSVMYGRHIIIFNLEEVEIRVYSIRRDKYIHYPVCIVDGILPYNKLINKLKKLKAFV